MIKPRALDPNNKFDRLVAHYRAESRMLGVDVSKWQGKIDWKFLKATNPWLSFAIAKCNQGGWIDEQWHRNSQEIPAAGFALAAYSFLNSDQPAQPQIDTLRREIEAPGVICNCKAVFVDVEDAHKCSMQELADKIRAFEAAFEKRLPVLVYSYAPYLAQFGHLLDDLPGLGFAIAAYTGCEAPPHPAQLSDTIYRNTMLYQFAGEPGIKIPLYEGGPPTAIDHDVTIDRSLEFYLKVMP